MAAVQALADEEATQLKRNAALAHAVKLWRKTHDLLEDENAAKERKLRQTVRRHLAGTDASSILTIGKSPSIHPPIPSCLFAVRPVALCPNESSSCSSCFVVVVTTCERDISH